MRREASPPDRPRAPLGSLVSLITKGTTPTTLGAAFSSEGVNFIKVESIDADGRVIVEKLAKIDLETDRLLRRSRLQADDILFSIAGAIGRTLLIPESLLPANTNQALAIIRPSSEKVVPRFLYYYLRSQHFLDYSLGRVVQTAQANVSLSELREAPIQVPPLATQRQIAAVLSAYDDLIANNLRRIRVLEEMAQALYREWFVELRVPGLEHGRSVMSPLGRIPEGWAVGPLGDHLLTLETGRRPKGGVGDVTEGIPSIGAENIEAIGRHNFESEKFVPREFFQSMKTGVVQDRDVAIYKDGAYIGKSSFFRDAFPHSKCCVNEHVFLLRTNGISLTQNSLYLWLRQPETIAAIRATNANAAQPGINQQSVRNLKILTPDQKRAEAFDRLVDPLLGQIVSLAKRNVNLRLTRDLLLPRLISGELDVSKFDIADSEALA